MTLMPIAYFLLNVALNHEFDVIENIKKTLSNIPTINYEIQGVFGIYDVIVKISSDDNKFHHILIEKIRSIEYIQSVITMIVNSE